MSTKFSVSRDITGAVTYGLMPSDDMQGVLLSQGSAKTFTVPNAASSYECIFSIDPGLRVFVAYGSNTAVAFSSTPGSVTSELNPTSRVLPAGSNISVITPDANAYVGIIFYAK